MREITKKVTLLCVGALLFGGVATGAYYGIDSSACLTNSCKNVDSSCQSEMFNSLDGKLGIFLPDGSLFNSVNLGDTKNCIGTISPSNVSCKTLNWTTSDSASISLASSTTESGATQILTLEKLFTGNVTITVTSALDSKINASFKVSVNNFITSATLDGIVLNFDGEITKVGVGQSVSKHGYFIRVYSTNRFNLSVPSLDDDCQIYFCYVVTTHLGNFFNIPYSCVSNSNYTFTHSYSWFNSLEFQYLFLSVSGSSYLPVSNYTENFGKIDGITFLAKRYDGN